MKKQFTLFIILTFLMVICLGVNVEAANKKTVTCKKQTFKVTLKLDADEDWDILSNKSWLCAKQSGSKLKVTVKANTSKKSRTGKITVETEDRIYKLTVVQKKNDGTATEDDSNDSDSVKNSDFDYDWLACAKRFNKKDVTKSFLKKVKKISAKLGVDPDDLMTVMAFESGLNHKAQNIYSNATGLIQFMPFTAIRLGTTVNKLKKMSAIKQLDYVYKYLSTSGKLSNLGDLYMAILWPQAVGKKDSYVLWKKGDAAYYRNSGLDVNHDGKVTRKECLKRVLATRKSYVGK